MKWLEIIEACAAQRSCSAVASLTKTTTVDEIIDTCRIHPCKGVDNVGGGNMAKASLNETELKVLRHLINDARSKNADIADTIGMSTSTVSTAILNIRKSDIVKQFTCMLDPEAIGFSSTGYFLIELSDKSESAVSDFASFAWERLSLMSMSKVIGTYDLVLRVWAKNNDDFQKSVEVISGHSSVQNVTSLIASTTEQVPIPNGWGEPSVNSTSPDTD